MYRKNFHEYFFSQPTSDNLYINYRQSHKKYLNNFQLQTAQTEITQLSEKAIIKVMQDLLNISN